MAQEQDVIGWRRFMEGMVCLGIRRIQASSFSETGISNLETTRWSCGLRVDYKTIGSYSWPMVV
jgi:hypothetical protein